MLVDTETNFFDDKRIYLDLVRRVFYRDTNLAVNIASLVDLCELRVFLAHLAELPKKRQRWYFYLSINHEMEEKWQCIMRRNSSVFLQSHSTFREFLVT